MEAAVFNSVNRLYGETVDAIWVSVDTLASYSGKVLFNNPTHKETLDQIEYIEVEPYFEYLAPAFSGLKFRVDSSVTERINISGTEYLVTRVTKLSDGNTMKAYVQAVGDGYGPVSE